MKANLENLSIIVLNYNSADLCISLVEKLIELDCGAHIFVVDNCSNDNSKLMLSEHLPKSKNVHLVLLDQNTGYANGNNAGIKAAINSIPSTDALLIMNPDIVVDDVSILYALYNSITSYTTIGAITTQTIYNNKFNQPNDCAWRFMTRLHMMFGGTLLGRLFVKSLKYDQLTPDENGFAYVDVVQGCFFMIRREVFEKAGMFDTHTFLYSEESILAKRLAKLGYKNAVLPGLYIHHNHREKSKNLQKVKNKLFDMKCYYDSRKYYICEYSDCGKAFRTFACLFLDIDYQLKVIAVKCKAFLQLGSRQNDAIN